MMETRSRPWLALLISALVHLGIAAVLAGQAGRAASGGGNTAGPAGALVVSLVSATRPVARDSRPALAAAPEAPDAPVAPQQASALAPHRDAKARDGDATPVEHHYFSAGEVTRQAVVVEGLVGDVLLVVPGMLPQTVSLQVWISDEGAVDRVELEAPLPEAEQQLLLAAFARVRFLPGRIGHIAVHSRVSMKIQVDYAVRA